MSYILQRNLVGHNGKYYMSYFNKSIIYILIGSVNAVRFTHDGNYCMTASEDRTVKLWNPHKDDPSKR